MQYSACICVEETRWSRPKLNVNRARQSGNAFIAVTHSLTDVCTADLVIQVKSAQSNLQFSFGRTIATDLYCCQNNEHKPISHANDLWVWAANDLQNPAAAPPALLAEDATSATSQR